MHINSKEGQEIILSTGKNTESNKTELVLSDHSDPVFMLALCPYQIIVSVIGKKSSCKFKSNYSMNSIIVDN